MSSSPHSGGALKIPGRDHAGWNYPYAVDQQWLDADIHPRPKKPSSGICPLPVAGDYV